MKSPFNVFITGVGGQGVITLANVLRSVCEQHGLHTTGSVIKGGAQRLGTVSASLRIFAASCSDYRDYSIGIPDGSLDLMIGLEPWECLRAQRLFGINTKIVLNTDSVPLLVARRRPVNDSDAITQLENLGVTIMAEEFTKKAVELYGDKRMLNFEMGRIAIQYAIPDFSIEYFEQSFKEATNDVCHA